MFELSKFDGADVVSGEGAKMNHLIKSIQKFKPEGFGKPAVRFLVHWRQVPITS